MSQKHPRSPSSRSATAPAPYRRRQDTSTSKRRHYRPTSKWSGSKSNGPQPLSRFSNSLRVPRYGPTPLELLLKYSSITETTERDLTMAVIGTDNHTKSENQQLFNFMSWYCESGDRKRPMTLSEHLVDNKVKWSKDQNTEWLCRLVEKGVPFIRVSGGTYRIYEQKSEPTLSGPRKVGNAYQETLYIQDNGYVCGPAILWDDKFYIKSELVKELRHRVRSHTHRAKP